MKATSYQFSGVFAGVGLSGGKVQNVNVSKNKNKTNNAKKANQKKMPKKQLNYNPRGRYAMPFCWRMIHRVLAELWFRQREN